MSDVFVMKAKRSATCGQCGQPIQEGEYMQVRKADSGPWPVLGCQRCNAAVKAKLRYVARDAAAAADDTPPVTLTVEFRRIKTRRDNWMAATATYGGANPPEGCPKVREFSVTGNLGDIREGDKVKVTGKWSMTEKWGWELKTQQPPELLVADGDAGLVQLLERLPDVDHAKAKLIVSVLGGRERAEAALEGDGSALAMVHGITPEEGLRLAAVWRESLDLRAAQAFIAALPGLSLRAQGKVLDYFGASAEEELRANPFSLFDADNGIGFPVVDAIATRLRITHDDPRRLAAAAHLVLESVAGDGHVWSPLDILCGIGDYDQDDSVRHARRLKFPPPHLRVGLSVLEEPRAVWRKKVELILPPEVLRYEDRYIPRTLDEAERDLTRYVLEAVNDREVWPLDVPESIFPTDRPLSEEQRHAVELCAQHRFVIVTGGPGRGKCVRAKELLVTERGLVRIADLAPRPTHEDEAPRLELEVPSTEGRAKTSCFYDGGAKPVIVARTRSGFTLGGSLVHPLWKATEAGPTWTELEDLKVGDYVALNVQKHEGAKSDHIDEECAWLLGALVADGSLNEGQTPSYTKNDAVLRARVAQGARKYLAASPIEQPPVEAHRSWALRLNGGVSVRDAMKRLDLGQCLAAVKYIPRTVMQSSARIWAAFLQGLFDGDGSVDHEGRFEYSTASPRLAEEVHVMLAALGIWASLAEKPVRLEGWDTPRIYYRITVSGWDIEALQATIGFSHTEKRQALAGACGRPRNTNVDVVPSTGPLIRAVFKSAGPQPRQAWYAWKREAAGARLPSRARVRQLLASRPPSLEGHLLARMAADDIRWDEIVSIEVGREPEQVYDLEVPGPHSFVASGFYVHNTHVTNTIIAMLKANRLDVACAAPTGKAAVRMAELTHEATSTIHRLYEYSGEGKFRRNELDPVFDDEGKWAGGGPIDQRVVIFDETSMVDTELAATIVRGLREHHRVIWVGDVDQLPSIGPGQVLSDLIESGLVPVARLTKIFRQAEDSAIPWLAKAINEGDAEEAERLLRAGEGGVHFLELPDPKDAADRVVALVRADPRRVVITPMKTEEKFCGTYQLNCRLQAELNPPRQRPDLKIGDGYRAFEGDRVIQTANNYDINVFNGETGRVLAANSHGIDVPLGAKQGKGRSVLLVDYTSHKNVPRIVAYDRDSARALALAYAVTGHRFQGSQAEEVVVPVLEELVFMMQRRWLYTAVTRASARLIVVGSSRIVAHAAHTLGTRRRTLLLERLQGRLAPPEVREKTVSRYKAPVALPADFTI